MTKLAGGIFNEFDRTQVASLNQRLKRALVIKSNIANAETPGYRAVGYDFESELANAAGIDKKSFAYKASHPGHMRTGYQNGQGEISGDFFVRPTESIPNDGNTVDLDLEMAQMQENQLLYRSAVELLNRKLGILRYAITGGN